MSILKLISPEDIDVDGATELYVSARVVRLIAAILKEARSTGDVIPHEPPPPPRGGHPSALQAYLRAREERGSDEH
jgi:hypothetical protein